MNVGQFLKKQFQGKIDVCLYVDKTASTPSAMVELQVNGRASAHETIAVAHWLAAHVHLRCADDERWILSVDQLSGGRGRLRFVLLDGSDAQLIRAMRAVKRVLEDVPLFGVECAARAGAGESVPPPLPTPRSAAVACAAE